MTREQLILIGFLLLTLVVFVLVLRKGMKTRQCFWTGIFSLVVVSVLAIGLHCFLAGDVALMAGLLPTPEMGLGVLFLLLASLGCLCSGVKE